MEYTIAMCDDKIEQLCIIEEYIKKVSDGQIGEIICANSGEKLLGKIRNKHVDIFFLDIEMDGINGLDLGKKLRETYKDTVIIFITGFKDYALNAFSIRAFDYIIKPITYEKFEVLFNEICIRLREMEYRNEKENMFTATCKDSTKKIKYNDIFYFEKSRHKIRAICRNENVEFYGSFADLKKELNMGCFTQCHQGYIINNQMIYSYKSQKILVKEMDIYIPVSKGAINEIKQVLSKNLFG